MSMRIRSTTALAGMAVLLSFTAPSHAVTIAYWDFNDGDLIADRGSGTITPSALGNLSLDFVPGTTVNALAGVAAGHALRLTALGAFFSSFRLDIAFDMTGYENPLITVALRADPSWRANEVHTHGVQVTWVPSADGGAGFGFGLQFVPPADFVARQVSQTSFGLLNGSPGALVRMLQNPLGLAAGDGLYLDNLLITASAVPVPEPEPVPEPGSLSLLLCTGILWTFAAWRWSVSTGT